jgi:hypothetical protein
MLSLEGRASEEREESHSPPARASLDVRKEISRGKESVRRSDGDQLCTINHPNAVFDIYIP